MTKLTPNPMEETLAEHQARIGKPKTPFNRFFLVRTNERECYDYASPEAIATDICKAQFTYCGPNGEIYTVIEQILEISPDVPPEDRTADMALKAWDIVANEWEGEDTNIDPFIREHVSDLDDRIADLQESFELEKAHVAEISSPEKMGRI